MEKIVISTGNAGKVREFKEILKDWNVSSMREENAQVSVEETGKTFEENAWIKARALAERLREMKISAIAIADDSGIEIDAFDGGPGVYSARFLGEDTPYEIKNQIILERMAHVEVQNRGARYVCVIAAVLPDGMEISARATVEGRIGQEPRGSGGFGYDPIFYVPEYGRTMAELTSEEKNQISHRGKALLEIRKKLGGGC